MYCHFLMVDKDSMASIHVVKDILKMPLDRIVTADIWFDDETPADLPEVWEFKKKMDEVIKQRWGITVEHHCARERERDRITVSDDSESALQSGHTSKFSTQKFQKIENLEDTDSINSESVEYRKTDTTDSRFSLEHGVTAASKLQQLKTYKNTFYRVYTKSRYPSKNGTINGFPQIRGNWCNELKMATVKKFFKGSESEVVQYIGIAADEPERIARHIVKPNIILPLVEAGWDEDMCGLWCKYSDMLSPTYSHSYRDGCWFCHNQGVDQLRYLYKNYPYLWEKLLALDNDSPVTFHADGHTVHDFDRRFKWEDEGYKPQGSVFRWSDLEEPQMNLFQFLDKDGG